MNKSIRPTTARVPIVASTLFGGLALLASACGSSSPGGGQGGVSGAGSGGSTGTGGGAASTGGATGAGGSGPGGSGSGGATGPGGSGAGGTNLDAGGGLQDASVDVRDARPDVVVFDGSTAAGGAYVRTGWTAAYTCSGGACPAQMTQDQGDVPARAFDGTLATRWSTGQFQSVLSAPNRFPLFFTVDMGQVMNVSRITMHPGCQDSLDSTATVEIFLSVDGTSLATAVFGAAAGPVHTVPSNVALCTGNPAATAANGLDTITFTQAPARFIQIKGTRRTNTDRYWAIGELNVYP